MKLGLYTVLDFLFLPSEDELLIREVDHLNYQSKNCAHWDYIYEYQNNQTKAAIHLTKYHNHKKSKQLLAKGLVKYLSKFEGEITLIPIPLSKTRERERGYNQVTEILKLLPRDIRILNGYLKKKYDTTSQSSLTRAARLQNISPETFVVKNTDQLKKVTTGKKVFLVDDVVTTGTTLCAAKAKLSPHIDSPITCLAFAH